MTSKPCSAFIVVDRTSQRRVEKPEDESTERRYCDGDSGHEGTHMGWRSAGEYKRLLREYRDSRHRS